MVLESGPWQCVEAVPAILFSVEGTTAVRAREPARRGWITVAEGVVEEVGAHHVWLGDGVTLSFTLPPEIDLRPLLGRYVRVTLTDEAAASSRGPRAQTLVVADERRTTLLVARFGAAGGHVYTIGGARVHAALSQRPGGPMAFGTDRLQYVVNVGERVCVNDGARDLVMTFVARTAFDYFDYAAYVVADRALWREPN